MGEGEIEKKGCTGQIHGQRDTESKEKRYIFMRGGNRREIPSHRLINHCDVCHRQHAILFTDRRRATVYHDQMILYNGQNLLR